MNAFKTYAKMNNLNAHTLIAIVVRLLRRLKKPSRNDDLLYWNLSMVVYLRALQRKRSQVLKT